MKICLFADSFLPRVGGMEFVIHHLANALYEKGCSVTVFARESKVQDNFERQYDLVRYGYAFRGAGRLGFNSFSAILKVLIQNKKIHFHVINCHGVAYAGNRARYMKKLTHIPLIMTPHGEDIRRVPEFNYGYRLKKRWDRSIRHNLTCADGVTAISDAIREELCFLPPEKLFLISNGIHAGRFTSQKSHFLHEALGVDPETRIVLSVGRNHAIKGYEYGIHAFKAVHDMGESHDLIYVLVGRDTHTLGPLVKSLSMNDKIFLLPQKDSDTVLKYYQSAWCFFSPSIMEGMSLVSIEAMAAGLPLIVTDVPGNREIVRDNDCGLIVRKKDPLSMAEGILSLASEQHLHDRLSRTASERGQLYDWRRIAEKYLEVYHLVADKYENSSYHR